MRRPPYHRIHHMHRFGPGRGPRPPVFLLLLVLLVVGGATMATMMVAMMLSVLPFVLVGVGAIAFRASRRARHRHLGAAHGHHVGTARLGRPATPIPADHADGAAPPQRAEPDWAGAKESFDRLRREYAAFECDPLAVLRLPALTDVSVGSTARFVDAFAAAQALDTDGRPPEEHRDRFVSAVDTAWRAWQAARDAAERIRLSGIPAEERTTVARAIKLLTVARDSDHETERRAAYSRARAELAKLERSGALRLPPTAAAALDAAARAPLPVGTSSSTANPAPSDR